MAEVREQLLRCAIYTRKSTEEGLEQSFHTLQAQREAPEAYILSYREEGWRTVERIWNALGSRACWRMWKRAASIAWWSTRSIGSAVRCSTSHAYCPCSENVA